jgi:hypothetical protein
MTCLRCDMDPIITELPTHIFRLYATNKNDITHDKQAYVRILTPLHMTS